ncbi:unnamed protein product, partial [Cyprideis torosa]
HLFFLLRDLVDPDLLPPRSFIDSLVLAYIDRLQESKLLPNGIAWYVTHLPDTQQVGIFAAFLSTLSTEEERSEALEAGRINGIAVQEATKKIVQGETVMVDWEVERSLRAMGFTGEPLPADFFEPDLSSDFIFSALESSKDIKIVREGRSPYCRVQRAMISNKFQDLTASQGFDADTDPQLLRFLVHLFFLLRDLVDPDLLPPRSFIDSLVLAYIDRLQESKLLPNGIAWYVTHLPDTQQVGTFAAFLSTLSTEEERSEALEAGRINGIAVQEAMKKIVQ